MNKTVCPCFWEGVLARGKFYGEKTKEKCN